MCFHGAGLTNLAPLAIDIADGLVPVADVYLPSIRASGFVDFDEGFRKPSGWAFHRYSEALADSILWLEHLGREQHSPRVLLGHSWGALLALAAAKEIGSGMWPAVLLSPLPSCTDLLMANFDVGESVEHFLDELPPDRNALCYGRPNAPYPFLSAGTIRDLASCRWSLRDLATIHRGPLLVCWGDKEHDALKQGIQSAVEGIRNVTLQPIKHQGHFYSAARQPLIETIRIWLDAQ